MPDSCFLFAKRSPCIERRFFQLKVSKMWKISYWKWRRKKLFTSCNHWASYVTKSFVKFCKRDACRVFENLFLLWGGHYDQQLKCFIAFLLHFYDGILAVGWYGRNIKRPNALQVCAQTLGWRLRSDKQITFLNSRNVKDIMSGVFLWSANNFSWSWQFFFFIFNTIIFTFWT